MKLAGEVKAEIQEFVYFFFKGTMAFDQLLAKDIDYLELVLADRQILYNCFEIFAAVPRDCLEATDCLVAERVVANYLVDLHRGNAAMAFAKAQTSFAATNNDLFWNEFLKLAKCFCYNSFPVPLKENYILWMTGVDAVPAFAVWTNVLEVDKKQCPLNAEYALQRANERLLLWDGLPANPRFAEWEVEQEIY